MMTSGVCIDAEDPGRMTRPKQNKTSSSNITINRHAANNLYLQEVLSEVLYMTIITNTHILPHLPSPLSNNTQLDHNGNITLSLTQQNLINPRPPRFGNLQQLLREIAHKEPRYRFLRTVHQDPDAAICEGEAVLGRRFGPFAAGLDEDGGVQVCEGPGGRLDGECYGGPGTVVHIPAAAYIEVFLKADAAGFEEVGYSSTKLNGFQRFILSSD